MSDEKSLTAKYSGECLRCGGRIRPGQQIVRSFGMYVHEECIACGIDEADVNPVHMIGAGDR